MVTNKDQVLVSKSQIKIPPDYKKVNRQRRSRGYNFEYSIVNAFNNHRSKDWSARRLGGSSSGLPDIVATNKHKSVLYSIEAKSGESNILYIPRDQIERCLDITDTFLTAYQNRYIVFAFKFKGNKSKKTKLRYRIFPLKTIIVTHSMKGISYNIVKEELTVHYIKAFNNIIINKDTTDLVQSKESIEEFVNWL